MRQTANIPPISSEIAAMIKSLDTIGILFGSLPQSKAKQSACTLWQRATDTLIAGLVYDRKRIKPCNNSVLHM